ncbi:MAG: radical SAM protein, partial [Planctomycetota bacterium]
RYKRKKNKRVQPQLGIAYIASYLLSQGLDVQILDGEVNDYSLEEMVDRICDLKPMAVGITTPTEDRFNAIDLANMIKARAKGIFVFAGGPHFSYSAQDALENVPGIDAVVIGEGEFTSLELLKSFEKGKRTDRFHDINGCAFRDVHNKVVITPPRERLVDPNEMPNPAWHLYDMDKYRCWLSVEEKTRAIGVISSRGCPYLCSFCSNSLNRKVRYRNPAHFIDEVQMLHERYGFPGLNFQDDSFTANAKHVERICHEILRRGLKLRWYCSLRINNTTRELLELMKEAGCVALGFGVESGSDKVLKLIKKGTDTDMIRRTLTLVKQVGFNHVWLFMMFSLPGETLEDIRIGSDFENEMRLLLYGEKGPKIILGGVTYIYPGTELETIARKNGNVFPPDFSWNRHFETDRAKLFRTNPYVPHFENPGLPLEAIYDFTARNNSPSAFA